MSQNFLDDYVDIHEFAKQVGRHVRTVKRWTQARDGLPFAQLGSRVLINVPVARDWLQARMHNPNPLRQKKLQHRRSSGRPRKSVESASAA
jgi:hypothetical protein